MTRALAHVLLPTCLLELAAIWILVPAWGLLIVPPLLVLPVSNLLIMVLAGGAATHWKSCEACFRDGKLIVRLPGKDFLIVTPSDTRVLPDNRLEVTGSGSRVRINQEMTSRRYRSRT